MTLAVYSDSGATTKDSNPLIGATIYLNADITSLLATTSTTVKLEVFNNSDVLQDTPLDTTHNFPANTNQNIKTDINSNTAPSVDLTGYTAGQHYVKLTVSGTGVYNVTYEEDFVVTAPTTTPTIDSVDISDNSITLKDKTTFTAEVSDLDTTDPDRVVVEINGETVILDYVSGTTWRKTVKGRVFGECSSETVYWYALDVDGDVMSSDTSLTITISQPSKVDANDIIAQLVVLMKADSNFTVKDNHYFTDLGRNRDTTEPNVVIVVDRSTPSSSGKRGMNHENETLSLDVWYRYEDPNETHLSELYTFAECLRGLLHTYDRLDNYNKVVLARLRDYVVPGAEDGMIMNMIKCRVEVQVYRSVT